MRAVEAEFAGELARVRPELSGRYAAALPGARAAVMGRLWRSLLYEPLPGLSAAGHGCVVLAGGRKLTGPERRPYDVRDEPVLHLDGHPHTHPAALLEALALPGTAALIADLDNSVASLALSRAGAPDRPAATPEEHEQAVIDGHPYHPGCRNRPGVSVAEQLAYMPEHRPIVRLDLLAVPARDCLVTGPWPDFLRDGDRLLLPVHPWQSEHVLAGLGLRPQATGVIPARPLMSVRTLAPLDGGPHLKTAFSTRMTSDVRDISPGSVRDCVPLSGLLTTVAARCGGGLRIARYLAGAAGPAGGRPSADVSIMLRDPTPAPEPGTGAGAVLPVAALALAVRSLAARSLAERGEPASPGPTPPIAAFSGPAPTGPASSGPASSGDLSPALCAVAREPVAWLAAFARLAWESALGMLACGIAMEAHGQNLLVALDGGGRPYRLIYRDLADIRISPERLARHGIKTPPVSARLLNDDPAVLHAKLFGSLIGTTFGSLISAFGQGDRAAEAKLWQVVAAAARDAAGSLPAADRAALFGERLPAKAHLLARMEGAGDRWITLPNPLAGTL
ncbi:IucA/IucC family C-terminal-domain containing protein [Nonomuraea sp. NPDC049309]|uniref:IucA/IucC family C-terminal-domain containing protein n=1 Tax=Nonomuraea sp. NPDC049309 TaxID=3364350 RepID=UPI00372076F8